MSEENLLSEEDLSIIAETWKESTVVGKLLGHIKHLTELLEATNGKDETELSQCRSDKISEAGDRAEDSEDDL